MIVQMSPRTTADFPSTTSLALMFTNLIWNKIIFFWNNRISSTTKYSAQLTNTVREAFKKKNPKKFGNFPNRGGVFANSKLFFGFFRVFSKSIGKTLQMAWFIQKCKEKKFTFVWGGGTLYCTIPYCTKLYSTAAKFGLKIFFCNSGWIRTYSLVSRCFWLT